MKQSGVGDIVNTIVNTVERFCRRSSVDSCFQIKLFLYIFYSFEKGHKHYSRFSDILSPSWVLCFEHDVSADPYLRPSSGETVPYFL